MPSRSVPTIEGVTRRTTRDLAALADMFPDAVATWPDLVRLGVDEALPAHKSRPGGGWTRLLTGVYLLTGGTPSRRQLVRAALLRAGPGAAVTGVESARRHGVRRVPAEAWARSLVRGGRLGDPAWNVSLRTADGRSLGVVDAWWDDVGMAWEIDSLEFHLAPEAYAWTMRKHSALAAAGVLVVHTLPSQLRRDAAGVLRDLAATHASAAARPRPPVTANRAH